MASPAAGTPPFLTKTYAMVEDPTTDETISWNDTGTAFVVWRPPEFARDLLPKYFKHSNFSSFVRQLNTYVSTESSSSIPLLFFFFFCLTVRPFRSVCRDSRR